MLFQEETCMLIQLQERDLYAAHARRTSTNAPATEKTALLMMQRRPKEPQCAGRVMLRHPLLRPSTSRLSILSLPRRACLNCTHPMRHPSAACRNTRRKVAMAYSVLARATGCLTSDTSDRQRLCPASSKWSSKSGESSMAARKPRQTVCPTSCGSG